MLFCVALIYIGTCFAPVIFDDNEGLYAGAVREMHHREDWIVPMSNGFPRVQKPPLVYWTMLVSTSVLGENEFALRLPNALATVGWIMATYLIARRMGGERFGVAAALVLASMLGVWVFNHLVQPEPFLACFTSLALWCLVESRVSTFDPEKNGRWYLAFWAFLALGAMSKGLHGALWPLGTALLAAIFVPSWRSWLRPILSWRGVAVFAVIVVPWYAIMAARFPGFLQAHFVNEQLGASLNTRFPADTKQLPIWQFYAQHLMFWLPWTLLFPAAIYTWLRRRRDGDPMPTEESRPASDIAKLLGIWTALILVTLIFSTRQDYYTMSCWGAVAIFLALPWMDGARLIVARSWVLTPCLLVSLTGVGALGFAAWTNVHFSEIGAGTASPLQSRDTFMDAITGISPALWKQFLPLLWIFAATAFLSGASAALFVWRRRRFLALLTLASASAVPLILGTIGFTLMSPYFSQAENARAINRELAGEPDAMVACEAEPNTASSLLYYLNARVHWVNAPFDDQYAQKVLGLGRDYYLNDGSLVKLWRSAAPVYFIVEDDRLAYWQKLLGTDPPILSRSGTRVVLCNRQK